MEGRAADGGARDGPRCPPAGRRRLCPSAPRAEEEQINGNATVSSPALGRALRDVVVISSPFPSFWTKSSRATMPLVSPHHHDQNPSRTVENEASWTEIGIIFSNSDCRLPSLIPPPLILEPFELSPSSRRFLPPPPMSIHRQVLVEPLQATVNLQ
uniref:Uncharacterized protein n=1 Tax=Oryza nivara TaxID=4536 RepID=A0A0E0HCD9_ORYNI